MLKFSLIDTKIRHLLGTIGVLSLALIIVFTLSAFPHIIEHYYAEGFFIYVSRTLHFIFNLIPFSFGDVLYIVTIGYLIYAFIMAVRMAFKRLFKLLGLFILRFLIGMQAAILIFYLFWGLNYYRPSAAQLLDLRDTTYTLQDLQSVTQLLIDSANKTRAALNLSDLSQSNRMIFHNGVNAIKNLSTSYAVLRSYSPKVKSSLISPLLNYMGTSGYYNPFTSEAQLNYEMPVFDRPFTACHEMSHQMGFGREDEANFIGFIAGIHSNERLLKYSAYYAAMEEFLQHLHRRDSLSYKSLKLQISPAVKTDLKADMTYWMKYAGSIGMYTSTFYDQFLKANNQPAGLKTYNRMIILTMAYYHKQKVYRTGSTDSTVNHPSHLPLTN